MNRDAMLQALTAGSEPWDILIIGGGATGLGVAVDAAAPIAPADRETK